MGPYIETNLYRDIAKLSALKKNTFNIIHETFDSIPLIMITIDSIPALFWIDSIYIKISIPITLTKKKACQLLAKDSLPALAIEPSICLCYVNSITKSRKFFAEFFKHALLDVSDSLYECECVWLTAVALCNKQPRASLTHTLPHSLHENKQ